MTSIPTPVHTTVKDQLKVEVYANRQQMGESAGRQVVAKMKELLASKSHIRMIFAAAPSQNEFLATLVAAEGIDWTRVIAFHMDEYIGLPKDAEQRFSQFLQDRLFNLVKPGQVHLIDSSQSIEDETSRYSSLLNEAPIDIVCLGIGENGHIAFNDPPVADFQDPALVKPVLLDDACRQQQVNDGCFATFDDVPTHALTLTIPALLAASAMYCMVPGPTKREAVKQTLIGPITTECPASILRTHAACTLFVDEEAFGDLNV